MSARDSGYDPRHVHPRSGAHPAGAPALGTAPATPRGSPAARGLRAGRAGGRATAIAGIAIIALVGLVGLGFSGGIPFLGAGAVAPLGSGAAATGGSGAGESAASSASSATAASGAAGGPSAVPPASGAGSASASASPSGVVVDTAFVPVTTFRTGRSSTSAADVRGIATGASPFASLVLVKADAPAELRALGVSGSALGSRLVQVASASSLMTTIAQHGSWLGFLRADQVGPGVRALAWGSASLFGERRVASVAAWPLHAQMPSLAGGASYSPSAAWTLFAAGDLGLDRGAALAIRNHGNNPNYLYAGGTATITGHCPHCSAFGWDLPYTRRTGHAGAVRALISGADLAIANMEEVAVRNWTFHSHGTVFTGNPAYLAGIRNAGFDWVSMGNNHVGDFGPAGVLQSMGYLTKYGLLHGGAGANTTAAHKPSIVTVNGTKVALLSYDTIAPGYNATSTKAGSARMTAAWLKHDIAAARAAGVQVVIVWPHWGVEYTLGPSPTQRSLAHAAIDAGADIVIGNHPHWAESMEVYKGHPIWYALGNFTFDQTWSEPTMEGISLELTFSGGRLVQAWMHPHLILDYAQPNELDPMGAGKVVLDQVFRGSKSLPW